MRPADWACVGVQTHFVLLAAGQLHHANIPHSDRPGNWLICISPGAICFKVIIKLNNTEMKPNFGAVVVVVLVLYKKQKTGQPQGFSFQGNCWFSHSYWPNLICKQLSMFHVMKYRYKAKSPWKTRSEYGCNTFSVLKPILPDRNGLNMIIKTHVHKLKLLRC